MPFANRHRLLLRVTHLRVVLTLIWISWVSLRRILLTDRGNISRVPVVSRVTVVSWLLRNHRLLLIWVLLMVFVPFMPFFLLAVAALFFVAFR